MQRWLARVVLLSLLGTFGCDKAKSKSESKETEDDEPKSEKASSKGDEKKGGASGSGARALTKDFPGDLAGATALVKAFRDEKTDRVALTRALRPDPADFKAIFEGEFAAKVEEAHKKFWDAEKFEGLSGGKPDQTEVLIAAVSTEDIAAWNDNAKALPGGYEKIKDKFKKGLVVYRFKYVVPGETLGMANDGLIHVNGHWVFVPKPWRGEK